MLNAIGNLYAMLFGWPVLAKANKALFYLAGRGLGLGNYASLRISGEQSALACMLRGKARPIVFDIGANEGEWLARVLAVSPDAIVHAFEPQERLAGRLSVSWTGRQVVVNQKAVGDAPGTLELFDYAGHAGSPHASLVPNVIERLHGGRARAVPVEVTTVDGYCAQNGITQIDLMKIDVEGFELKVLDGAAALLNEGRVAAVQFEFNEMNVLARAFLADFMDRLGKHYDLYRILTHGLMRLKPSAHWLNEQFAFQNVVAILKVGVHRHEAL